MMRRLTTIALAATLAALLLLAGCSTTTDSAVVDTTQTELHISAATTLKRAFEEMEPVFEAANPGVDVVLNFGASGILQKQVEGGAPCDVFASASPKQVDALVGGGFVSAEETSTFCGNEVAIIVPAGNADGVTGPQDLTKLERLTTGDPETAPHGTKAKEWLGNLGLWDTLESKFVFAENAAQTLDYVSRGEVDAGLVFASEATNQDSVEIVYTAPASELTSSIKYVMAPTSSATDVAAAKAFVDYVLSADGQATLAKWGFVPVADTK